MGGFSYYIKYFIKYISFKHIKSISWKYTFEKGENLQVRSTDKYFCQFGFIHCQFFRGRRQGRQPLNNYIIIYLAPTWGRPFTSATDFSSCQKCGRTEAPQLFPPFSFDQAQDFLIWVLQVTTSFDSIYSIIQHYTALTCCNAWHILTNILIMLDISWYFQDISGYTFLGAKYPEEAVMSVVLPWLS